MTEEKVLVVGCGLRPKKYATNLDCVKLPGVDIIHNLDLITRHDEYLFDPVMLKSKPNNVPAWLPFLSESFDRVEAEDVLEHVADAVAVVQELGRVLKVGGRLWVRGPDCRFPERAWADITHRRLFAPRTFDGFCPDTFDGKNYGHYHGPIKFRMIERAKQNNEGLEFTLERI